jgi:hypothetical protein
MRALHRNLLVFSFAILVFLLGLGYSLLSQDFPNITGMVVARLTVVELSHKWCNASLTKGWNLVGIPCFPDSVSVRQALGSLFRNTTNVSMLINHTNRTYCLYYLISVHSFDQSDSNDSWKSYNPCMPSYVVQDLSYLNDKQGYFIRVRNSTRLNYEGDLSIPNYVPLYKGWNLVSYDANDTLNSRPVATSIDSINNSYIAFFNYFSGFYQAYNSTVHRFTNFVPFHGYWFNMLENATWVIDW